MRLDLSHSGWSDIFFLGMDYPEGARVLNISVDLGVHGRDDTARPPIETFVRRHPRAGAAPDQHRPRASPRTSRTCVTCSTSATTTSGLVKAGVIASGLIPPVVRGNRPVHGGDPRQRGRARAWAWNWSRSVNDIPKGSRLAVSTNLLASHRERADARDRSDASRWRAACTEQERRLVASRAILGEWLGGSGGGWQDSGGIWPGFKVIEGAAAREGDPEYGISRGRLLPQHRILAGGDLSPRDGGAPHQRRSWSVHGGMAQNVGPILEMVTEKYLLRGRRGVGGAAGHARDLRRHRCRPCETGDVRALGVASPRATGTAR